jgi:hypothetical protein
MGVSDSFSCVFRMSIFFPTRYLAERTRSFPCRHPLKEVGKLAGWDMLNAKPFYEV